MLDSFEDVDTKLAAGECISLIFELSRINTSEEQKFNPRKLCSELNINFDTLVEILEELANPQVRLSFYSF